MIEILKCPPLIHLRNVRYVKFLNLITVYYSNHMNPFCATETLFVS